MILHIAITINVLKVLYWFMVVGGLSFLSFYRHPYFTANPRLRLLARIALGLYLACTIFMLPFPSKWMFKVT